VLRVGPVVIDVGAHRVYVEGAEVRMSAMELRLLVHLVERRGAACPRSELLQNVWQYRGGISSRTVDTHMKRLRDKLRSAAGLLETVRAIGYRLSGTYPVLEEASPPAESDRRSLRPSRADTGAMGARRA
jgi:two-component system phosphate regulon response regulator PhoB